jgi:hypothetical protein
MSWLYGVFRAAEFVAHGISPIVASPTVRFSVRADDCIVLLAVRPQNIVVPFESASFVAKRVLCKSAPLDNNEADSLSH